VRILLLTGKGGVGKTTTAAATALRCAAAGHRTLVVSTDPAHSLADAFGTRFGVEPEAVTDGVWAHQVDTRTRMEESWGEIRTWLLEVLTWAGVDSVEAEELSILPGLDEVVALTEIERHERTGRWDVLVVDCAPTAETVRLLSLPDVARWYMERLFPVTRRLNRVAAPVLSRVGGLPTAGDDVFGATLRFYDRLDRVRTLLADPARTSVRLVVNPERMVIAEARRTATYLALFGYRVDAVVANRLLPEAVTDPWFDRWRSTQRAHLATIEEGFAPLPVLRAELAPGELVGVDALRSFGDALYGELDAATALHDGAPLRVVADGDLLRLELELPFAARDDLEVARHHDELLVRVGPYRRSVLLPDSLRRRRVADARLVGGMLTVGFAPDRGGAPGSTDPGPSTTRG
jgi:arsenite-transporting ATPase